MKSPFPGMDPFLESRWGDVHSRLSIYASDVLNRALPSDLVARAEERALVCEDDQVLRALVPDVSLHEKNYGRDLNGGEQSVAVAESVAIDLDPYEFKQHFLEIREARSGGKVITVIEFVSPFNKRPGDGLNKYQQKQQECREAGVNLVEIDLTRSGNRALIMPIENFQTIRTCTYLAAVTRASRPNRIHFHLLPIQKRLGGVPIPLRPHDQEIILDLQALMDQVYQNGRYGSDINYTEALTPELSTEDSIWMQSLLDQNK